jgi:cytosine/adenosine deaminase-related metal-dependent hydrolase
MGRMAATLIVVTMLAGGCTTARSAPSAAAPAALPAAAISADQRVVAYPHGRWQLYGDGTTVSPYTWVWIPTGAAPPPPAPPAR